MRLDCGSFDMKEIAYVLGGGRCVWDDLEGENLSWATVFCVNDIGMYLQQPFQHWVSYHGAFLVHWAYLWERHNPKKAKPSLHSFVPADDGMVERWKTWEIQLWKLHSHGTSAHLAVEIALEMGFDDIRLLGVPLDGCGRFFDPPGFNNFEHPQTSLGAWVKWKKQNPDLADRVRSKSGNTRELLGGWQ